MVLVLKSLKAEWSVSRSVVVLFGLSVGFSSLFTCEVASVFWTFGSVWNAVVRFFSSRYVCMFVVVEVYMLLKFLVCDGL